MLFKLYSRYLICDIFRHVHPQTRDCSIKNDFRKASEASKIFCDGNQHEVATQPKLSLGLDGRFIKYIQCVSKSSSQLEY